MHEQAGGTISGEPPDIRLSLSSLLSGVELHGQNWCYVDLGHATGFSIPSTRHVFVHIVLEGQARFTGTAHCTIILNPGDAIMVASGEAHAIRDQAASATVTLDNFKHDRRPDCAPVVRLGRSGGLAAQILTGKLKLDRPPEVAAALPPILMLGSDRANQPVKTNALTVALGSFGREPGGVAQLTKLASSMLVRELRCEPHRSRILHATERLSPARRAIGLMSEHPAEKWSVAKLARSVGLSRSKFAALFKAELGRPPMEVLTERRLAIAADLLLRGDLKIGEISTRVGYQSESAFSRRFSGHFGVRPGRMRADRAAARGSA